MRKDCVARELTREIVVGTFMVTIFLGLAYFTIILSRETWFSPKVERSVYFKDVMGLREGDPVVVRGMPIGKVRRLELVKGDVRVDLLLDKPIHVKKDYRITIVATSILGGRYLDVDEGSASLAELPAGTFLRGVEPYDLMSDAAELVNAAREGVVDGGIIDNLKVAAQQLREVSERLNNGKGALGKLLSEDDTLYNDLAATVASLKEVAARLESGQGTFGKLLSEDDTMYEDLSATVASLKEVAKGLEKGEGTIGQLMTDDGLYTDVRSLVDEFRATVDDYRETSPITTFSSIFFGAF